MIQKQQSIIFSEFIGIYEIVVPKDNVLRKISELVDFSFVYDELKENYCLITVEMPSILFVCSNIYC